MAFGVGYKSAVKTTIVAAVGIAILEAVGVMPVIRNAIARGASTVRG